MPSPRPARRSLDFDPQRHAGVLGPLLDELARAPRLDAAEIDRILRRHPKDGRGLFSRSELLAGLRALRPADEGESPLASALRLRPVRTLSGVTPVTVLTKPFPCPGRCIFCPDDVRMPKSYLSAEPGCQRAEDHGFDPYAQTWSRLEAYRAIGHPTDKVELIVLGGTWSAYPEPYRIWFVERCLEALADFGAGVDGRGPVTPPQRRADPAEAASWESLQAVQRAGESAACRCVGLSVETRPDHVDAAELYALRRLGVTKLQVGVQSLSDAVLAANRRGHDVAATRRALRGLRAVGFKLHLHWMPNLLGATPASDVADFARLFDDPDFRPDELKIYPCLLVESAELAGHHARGEWRAYDDAELLGVLQECLAAVPPWCRVTRVVRDFSSADIVAGTRQANLREVAERRLRDAGRPLRDIRAREVRAAPPAAHEVELEVLRYATSVGEERFLQLVAPGERLVGFLRLSLPREAAPLAELGRAAVIREVHVYGASLELGRRAPGAQHRGFGSRLVERAVDEARDAGFASLAVISAIGTRPWYRTLGFEDGALYQHRAI